MYFKKMKTTFSFADISLYSALEHNRDTKRMEQINAIMNTDQHEPEHLSFSLGPPHYSGSYYGTISISDFTIAKKQ